ncbi:MAG: hypothetical protein H8E66_27760 [Planctomycetes bacterium]|nr:hypothetical protein [Planctomycetota bacterium]
MLKRTTLPVSIQTKHVVLGLFTLFSLVTICGCHPPDEISRYQIARANSPHRMLAAIVPQGDREWFFKLTGANEAVANQTDNFTAFLKSIQFGEGDEADPQWELAEGWTQEPGKDMRFATIKIAADEQELELSVTPLPKPPTDGTVANINRWRGQLGLAPIEAGKLAEESTSVEYKNGTATMVNLVGKSGASAPMTSRAISRGAADPDAARIAAHAAAGVDETRTGPMPAAPPSSITYEAPPEWKPGKRVVSSSAFAVPREAAFEVTEGDSKAEITVTALGAGASALLPNVNRWRNQIGLEPFTNEQLATESKKIDMNGVEGDYFRLIGPQQAILGVIATHGGKAWFVKLQGEHDLAVKLQEDFESFARSIKF